MTTVGERLRAIRTVLGLDQAELEDLIGYSPGAVNHIEQGRTKKPGKGTFGEISRVLGERFRDYVRQYLETGEDPRHVMDGGAAWEPVRKLLKKDSEGAT